MVIEVKRNPMYMHIYNIVVDGKRLEGAIRGRGVANNFAMMIGELTRRMGTSARICKCHDKRYE